MSDSNLEAQRELTRLNRCSEPISPTFSNMPIEIVNQVLEKSKPIDRLSIRKVCKNLRTCVDRLTIHFDEITFVWLGNNFILETGGTDISYTDAINGGSTVKYGNQEKCIEGVSAISIALQDLKTLLKYTSELGIVNSKTNAYEIIPYVIDVLKSMKCIKVKRIFLKNFSFDDVVTMLQCFDTEALENIVLWSTNIKDQFEKITCLDQWKCAKKLYLSSSVLESRQIVHLFHLNWFNIELDNFPTHIAIKIRDDLMKRSTFQGCYIQCDRSNTNASVIAKVFKPDYFGGNELSIQYSTDNANFEIQLYSSSSSYSLGFRAKILKNV